MDALFATMRKLHPRGPGARGLVVDHDGVMLGPDCELIRRSTEGYRRLDADQVARLQGVAFGKADHCPRLPLVLDRIVDALSAGDLVRAQLLGLSLRLGELDDDQLRRLRLAAAIMKAGYNPAEPRDEDGKWTDGSEGSAASLPSHSALPPIAGAATAAEAGAEIVAATGAAAALLPEMASFWARAALSLTGGGAVLALGAVLVPMNRSNVSEGTLPGSNNALTYRYDEGILTLSYRDADGRRIELFNGRPGTDGTYRDDDGNVIARRLENGEGFVLAPDALPALSAKIKGNSIDRIDPKAIKASVAAYSEAAAKSEPRLCPDPTPDPGKPTSLRAGMYQWQVCGLPPGWGIEFNGARFDGCDIQTGVLSECMGQGFADKMKGSVTDDWPWPSWFTIDKRSEKPTGMASEVNQLAKENRAATEGGRPVMVHVAEPAFAEWLRIYAARQGHTALHVIHTPPPPFNTSVLLRLADDHHSDWSVETIA